MVHFESEIAQFINISVHDVNSTKVLLLGNQFVFFDRKKCLHNYTIPITVGDRKKCLHNYTIPITVGLVGMHLPANETCTI